MDDRVPQVARWPGYKRWRIWSGVILAGLLAAFLILKILPDARQTAPVNSADTIRPPRPEASGSGMGKADRFATKPIAEETNGTIRLTVSAKGTFRVSIPAEAHGFHTLEGHALLSPQSPGNVPAGLFIKIKNSAGEILSTHGWHTPLFYSSNATIIPNGKIPLSAASGDSGMLDLSGFLAFLERDHKMPDLDDLEFKLQVNPGVMLLFKPDGTRVTGQDLGIFETEWLGGNYLKKRE